MPFSYSSFGLNESSIRTRLSSLVSMGGPEEGNRTMMEVDSIVAKVVTKSTQVAPHTIEATTKTVHPSTLAIIVKINKVIENLH
jgi:hypothetical protein